ncbi:DUF899 domain-containing protein [Amycolatopsis sp. OK19-0408]|uniref:DUF899 domain-containing protein n=1 Tax=Amycolatopsis iheyensis TaxID=2945988 RepID=A0A9X2SKK1_9PSEU|nr:DUF899 domain-containing protein [Amycolatopsis iheyensis]MCR6483490.1 DUF899 domain-containing protein [Amycolatopsis iheyensis]
MVERTEHRIGTRAEWRTERIALLEAEKELTRRADELAARRADLPWVRVGKDYAFQTPDGPASLGDLFAGRSQLLVYHMMNTSCPACASMIDGLDGFAAHLQGHDVAVAVICRSPIEDIAAFGKRQGWTLPLVSSQGSDFNADFEVFYDEDALAAGAEHNYRALPLGPEHAPVDTPGMSAFARAGGELFHTYSAYTRGLDVLNAALQWLDRAPLGRNEAGNPGGWLKLRTQYDSVHDD